MHGILKGLKAVHGAGFVHNDLHPKNIMMKGYTPKVGDFGVCREVGCCQPKERTRNIR